MKPETKNPHQGGINCQNCKNNFIIEVEDFNFYEKMKVPPPTWCPECRLIRRLAYREERALYKDKCENCSKNIVSLFAPGTPFKVFCSPCWWGDTWEGTDYGMDYDFSKPFFEQLHELQKIVPNQATHVRNSTDCYYCQVPIFSCDSIDSDGIWNADHTYETYSSNGVYNVKFTYFSDECLDSSFLFNCIGCTNCFGCVNLRNKKYCIWNKQYEKIEDEKEISKWDLGSYENIQKAKKKFMELYYKTPRRFALILNSSNVVGDDIKNAKNCQNCFFTRNGVENCKYIFTCALLLKDSQDVTFGGDTSELLYEVSGSTQAQRTKFSRGSNSAVDVEYSEQIYNCSNLFGCVKLRNKKYCILNKQYTKKEYEKIIPKIKKHMNEVPYIDKKGRVYKYGEFYPSEHSLWAYNESWANQYFPLSKEEALEKGFYWRDDLERDYKITIKPENLPDHIKDVPDFILNAVIECEHNGKNCNQQCTSAYRILPNELRFYRQMNIALPKLCPNCRHYERLKMVNPPKLWHRKCMCNGIESDNKNYKNTVKHFHENNPCQNEFETTINDKRREIVYCEKCYQAEFI
jgi:hypothetical protein